MDRAPRILIVQDRVDTTRYQVDTFARVARDFGRLDVASFNLKLDPDELVARLKHGEHWDWMVADLLEDAVDVDPMNCAGVNLIRQVRAEGLFGGYAKPSRVPRGIRCVGVFSALLGDGNLVGRRVADELAALGVQRDWMTAVGDISLLARRILERLQAEGCFGQEGGTRR